MSEHLNSDGHTGITGREQVTAAPSTNVEAAQPGSPDPYPPTPDSPDKPSVYQSTGHNNPKAPRSPAQVSSHQPVRADSQSAVPHASPHITFALPTGDRDDSGLQEPDPMPASDPFRLRTMQRPHDHRLGLVRAINRPAFDHITDSSPSTSACPQSPRSSSTESTHEVIRTQSEPDVAAAAQLDHPRIRRISYPRDHPRSGYHRCRDWCAMNCKQMWYAAKFTLKPKKKD